jgi:hypothetical protein
MKWCHVSRLENLSKTESPRANFLFGSTEKWENLAQLFDNDLLLAHVLHRIDGANHKIASGRLVQQYRFRLSFYVSHAPIPDRAFCTTAIRASASG